MRLTDLGHTVRLDVDGLTDAQRAALAIDRELVVTAGAGAGKTHVLSLRYVALLLALAATGDDDVERVVVLTFTDKAAHEMAERCHRTLLQVIAAARVQVPRIVPALERIEDRFDRARIGTFHGFCARILREFPAETGTPPGSTPLPPGEARVWIDQALDDALVAHLAATPSDVVPLLDAFGSRAGLVDAGRVALDRLGILDEVLADHAADRVDLAQAVAEARPTADEARAWIDGVGLPSLQLLRRLTAPSGGGPFVTRTLIPALDALSAETSPAPADDPLAVYARYREVLEVLITDAGTVRSLDHHTVLGTRDTWPDERRYKLAKEASKVLIARLGDWGARAEAARLLPTSADRALLAALGPFARWVRAAAARLGVTLTRQRKLTFEELQRRAIRVVVGDERLRTTLRDRFRYLMVDEFQDTDGPQWTLVRALARANPAVPEDRLFLVGDPKQAIYGFRGGDVSVFRRAIDELGVDPIVLPDNFRSRPTLIDWFNRTFPSILGPEAPYAPLVARRPDPGGQVVQLRVADADQAEATARWIAAALVDDPGRIAILLRSRTRQARYEAALRAHHVPYVVVSGVGFWTRPEVVDAVNWVRALAVGDPLSIVGALRSPLGALLDAEVAEVAAAGWRHPGLAPWLALRHAVPPSALIRALAGAALPAVTLDDPSGRAAANLERLAAWVAPFDGLGLGQVADRLAAEVDVGADRGAGGRVHRPRGEGARVPGGGGARARRAPVRLGAAAAGRPPRRRPVPDREPGPRSRRGRPGPGPSGAVLGLGRGPPTRAGRRGAAPAVRRVHPRPRHPGADRAPRARRRARQPDDLGPAGRPHRRPVGAGSPGRRRTTGADPRPPARDRGPAGADHPGARAVPVGARSVRELPGPVDASGPAGDPRGPGD
ncbi:MAG: UvrD-helicase domain-containing protein, partial [Myxococcota bacterium]